MSCLACMGRIIPMKHQQKKGKNKIALLSTNKVTGGSESCQR